jgi:pyrroline-5-carboxylate reductase
MSLVFMRGGAYTGSMTSPSEQAFQTQRLVFIGGGNMAGAILGGLVNAGRSRESVIVVEPFETQAALVREKFGVRVEASGGPALAGAGTVVWAVKPQVFAGAAAPCAAFVRDALQVSVMAGVRSETIAAATGSERVVRTMPNTPALIGQGIAGLYARAAVTAPDRAAVEALLAPTGQTVWVDDEADLDAVTALSGSGPAYVFYFVEAMMQAAVEMGLDAAQGRRLALATFRGATALAEASEETPEALRARVTSKGGTTHAAITTMESRGVKEAIVQALRAAQARARELGQG